MLTDKAGGGGQELLELSGPVYSVHFKKICAAAVSVRTCCASERACMRVSAACFVVCVCACVRACVSVRAFLVRRVTSAWLVVGTDALAGAG